MKHAGDIAGARMGTLPQRAERRQFGRRQTYAHGIISARGRPDIPCIMRDVSDGGALLDVAYPQWLPSRFRLTVELSGFQSDCEIVRRMENSVGVRFLVPITYRGQLA